MKYAKAGAAAGCDLLIFQKQDQKIAACGSSYRDAYNPKKLVGCPAAIAGKPAPTEKQKQNAHRYRSSPLNRMSVSSAAAFDLDPPAPSAG
ncbi:MULTISPECIES: hypothetical protein [Pseudomonas]|uniref:Uncharacterized protein n=1 Tax=Pseudomonas iridis TaxID=2710587 RepID=A0ABW8DE27_9PSED|nr:MULTISPECIES: hypothetical protein [Pseudomonas]